MGKSELDKVAVKTRRQEPDVAAGFHAAWHEAGDAFRAGQAEQVELVARSLLADAVDARASDIHLDPASETYRLRFRVDGLLHEAARLSKDDGLRLLRFFKTASELDPGPLITPEDARAEFDLAGRSVEIRLGCTPALTGEKLALRLLPKDRIMLSLGELGLGEEQRELIDHWLYNVSGMFLDVGPVGSGKTTTLYALLSELDLERRNIVTIEDPVEYQVDGITQVQVEERRGLELGAILRTVLRLDPDYLLLGEMRDEVTASAAIDAAATGRVVLSTLHARDAAGAVTSLRNLGAKDHEIATALSFVVSQRLVRKLCPGCREPVEASDLDRRWLDRLDIPLPGTVWGAPGCETCGDGFFGRTGVFELWPVDAEGYDLLLKGADERTIRLHVREKAGGDLLKDGLRKAADGTTTLSELRGISGLLRPR